MKYLYLIIPILLISHMSFGQSQGRVIDKKSRGIADAFVLQNSHGAHVHTDLNGNYTLENIQIGDTLLVNSLGYKSITRIVKDPETDLTFNLSEKAISLNEVVISPELDALNIFAKVSLETNPVNNSQELLRTVPGLVIGQHAGGGKAEQIFLRGFDIDHGTDISISVDGMPVNMVSHAHGQGYADMHWVTPETVEALNFGKGPYYVDQGDFNTTGFIDYKLKDRLDNSLLRFELGQFNTQRMLGMFNILDKEKQSAWISSEYLITDGPFESPQNFNRLNLMGRYTAELENKDRVEFTASYFTSSWDASGQIPQRAVDNGTISRFGAIDDTEGGETSRMNLQVEYTKQIDETSFIKSQAYYSKYAFQLYSNFTFFLEDSLNGDQIMQQESRQLFGGKTEYNKYFNIGSNKVLAKVGAGFRNDQTIDSELSHTKNRITTLDSIKLGDINQTNSYAYGGLEFTFGKWKILPGLRYDFFQFDYYDKLLPNYKTQSEQTAILSPKLNFQYNYSKNLQIYLNSGKGFHSNDARVVVAQNGEDILPAAYGVDFGTIWKPVPTLIVNAAIWTLYLDQEFVYVGDAGIVEPGGESHRQGVDFSLRYQPLKWLYADVDVNYTLARSANDPEGQNFIPLAPDFTVMGGLSALFDNGIYAGVHVRHIDDRPANEDNSIVAVGYTVVDLNAGWRWEHLELGIKIQNLFNVDWNETQFATETLLPGEAEPVTEITFTPGTPFFATGVISYRF